MNNIDFREATPNDLFDIVNIYNDIITEGGFSADLDNYTVDQRRGWFSELNTEKYGIYIVEQNNSIIGFFYFSPWRNGRRALDKTAEVSFYLQSSSRESGTGKKIMKWITELAYKKKFEHLLAILLDTNHRSKHLLEQTGFVVAGHLKNIVQLKNNVSGQLFMLKDL